MKQWKKRGIALAGVLILSTGSFTGCGSVDSDEAVATVDKTEISYGVANFYARMQQGQYETYYAGMMGMTGEDMWKQEIEEGKTYEDSVKESVLENLENMYLIRQHASDYEVALTDEELKAIEKAAKNFDEDNALEDKEAVSGYKKYVEEFLTLATLQSKMEEPMKAGVDEEVSDEEAAQKSMKYVVFSFSTTDADGNSVDMDDTAKDALKSAAQELVDSVEAGTDFDTAASNAGLTAQKATFDAESTSPNEDLVKAASTLGEGEVTDVIETDYGLYVAQVTSLLDREATDAEKQQIVENRKQEQYDSLIESWREEADIQVNEKVWKKIGFQNQGVTIVESEEAYDDPVSEDSAD